MKKFTLRLIKADMLLNWFLGFVFVFFPLRFEKLIASGPLLRIWLWATIGTIFLGFAAWQVGIVKRNDISSKELVFAALMAWVPVVLLTVGLLMDFPLFSWARAILWTGNIYMFILGGWYLYLSKSLSKNLDAI